MDSLFSIQKVSGLLTPDQRLKIATGEAFLSWGVQLCEEGYLSTCLGTLSFTVGGSPFIKMKIFVNTPVPERLPTWPKALSLKPDLNLN